MPAVTCCLCGTNAFAQELYASTNTDAEVNARIFSARRSPDRLHGRILRCGRCGLVYADSFLEDSKLASLYRESSYTYDTAEIFIRRTYGRYLRRAFRAIGRPLRDCAYLDIGCGRGFMLSEALAQGCGHVLGVEPSADAITRSPAQVRDAIVQGMFPDVLPPERRFDCISCFQTLDHIVDPPAFVRVCLRALLPGGVVLFINHNIASLTARLLGERCPMIDIEHTYLHTPRTMRLLFVRAGFDDIRTFAVRNDYPLSYWMHIMPACGGIKPILASWINRSRLGDAVIPLFAGNLGLIARCPQAPASSAAAR